MKKKVFLPLLLLTLMLVQCSKDESPSTPTPDFKAANLLATGASANDILANDVYSNMVIEAVYNPGFRPTSAAMAEFVNFLQERTFKLDISVTYREIPSEGVEKFSIQQAADLEEEVRTLYNDGDTIAIYIYFSDTISDGDDPQNQLVTLGASYRNTSMIIYEQTIKALAAQSSEIGETDIESATLMHEFGHLFGLVDLGTAQVNNHSDPTSSNHCITDNCLMQAEIQFGGGMMGMLQSLAAKGSPAPALDAECILDLQANGGK
ncbi:MAG: hypothetical protein HKN89_06485 [Eudoraea sp.]|nr:hypothetical protein [Eudoraea sp.]